MGTQPESAGQTARQLCALPHTRNLAQNKCCGYVTAFPVEQKALRMIRDDIKGAQIAAMKAGDKPRLATVRLMMARIKDRDIELRTGTAPADDDAMIVELLQKMVKQRRESIAMFETGGRPEKAAEEAAEIAVIEDFLPAQMDAAATSAAIEAIKAALGASSMKDMGRVMAELRARHGSTLDMGNASALVKAALGG